MAFLSTGLLSTNALMYWYKLPRSGCYAHPVVVPAVAVEENVFVSQDHFPHFHKDFYNVHTHLNRLGAFEHIGQHEYPMLCESIGKHTCFLREVCGHIL